MRRLSMLLPVYNEGLLLNYSLATTLPFVDEAIITDGGPNGPSTDETKNIINAYSVLYPKKIKYFPRTDRLKNGAWDESATRNFALSQCTGDFIIPHCGDMIYTYEDMMRIREIVDSTSNRIYYYFFIEFWRDHKHIRCYGGHAMEARFPVLAVGDIPILAKELIEGYTNGPHIIVSKYTNKDFHFIPQVFRYHFGWISGFEKQVMKHYRNIRMGQWKEAGEELMKLSDGQLTNWAVHHVLDYATNDCGFDYCGTYPIPVKLSYLDGYDETIAKYKTMYGNDIDV